VNLGAEHPEQSIGVGKPSKIAFGQAVADLQMEVDRPAVYRFTLYAANRWNPILIVQPE
jgi:hypothetical protein